MSAGVVDVTRHKPARDCSGVLDIRPASLATASTVPTLAPQIADVPPNRMFGFAVKTVFRSLWGQRPPSRPSTPSHVDASFK